MKKNVKGDCCRCCYAAVERGVDIGHTPGPGACPYPPCDWCGVKPKP